LVFILGILLPFNTDRPGTQPGILSLRLLEKRLEQPRHALTPGGSMRRKLRAKALPRKGKREAGYGYDSAISTLRFVNFML
jgi:hypothetical protein